MEAIHAHRAGRVPDLTPAEEETKKDEGGGRGPEADELGHESLGTVQLLLQVSEEEVRKAESGNPREWSISRIGPSILLGLRADGCPGGGFLLGLSRTLSGSVSGLCHPDLGETPNRRPA